MREAAAAAVMPATPAASVGPAPAVVVSAAEEPEHDECRNDVERVFHTSP